MSNVLVRAKVKDDALNINGVDYPTNDDGQFTIPEAHLGDAKVLGACTVAAGDSFTGAQAEALATAGKIAAGTMVYVSDLNKPAWRNAANSGWVDGAGSPLAIV